jgi:hypothetical protein
MPSPTMLAVEFESQVAELMLARVVLSVPSHAVVTATKNAVVMKLEYHKDILEGKAEAEPAATSRQLEQAKKSAVLLVALAEELLPHLEECERRLEAITEKHMPGILALSQEIERERQDEVLPMMVGKKGQA